MVLSQRLKEALERVGYQVEAVFDGDSGVRRVLETAFDMVLLDLLLPGELGIRILERVREAESKEIAGTPVIVITNYANQQYFDQCKKLGAVDYLVKSDLPLSSVVEKVTHHLGARGEG